MSVRRLRELLRELGAVKFGNFTLASGKTSDVYVDGRLLTLSSEGAAVSAALLWDAVQDHRPDAVGGMTLGADPIVGAMLAHAGRLGVRLAGCLVRKQAKAHGTKKRVEGPRPDVDRPRVVVFDDTMTTGGSTLDAARCIEEEWGAEIVAAGCIVGRDAGARELFAKVGIPYFALIGLDELRA
jgi:orotate phosphoribosyltransferase